MATSNNIKRHNAKYIKGTRIKGALILEVLGYSKNGKSNLFLWECENCHQPYKGNAKHGRKLCPTCSGVVEKPNDIKLHPIANEVEAGISGIYTISYGDYVYVGETFNIRARWHQHMTMLEQGKHHNKSLQRAYNKGKQLHFNIEETYTVINKDYKAYYKVLNLIKEHKLCVKYSQQEKTVLNHVDTWSEVRHEPNIKAAWHEIRDSKIKSYDEVITLPCDITWKEVYHELKKHT